MNRNKAALSFVPDFGAIEETEKASAVPATSWPVIKAGANLTCEGSSTSKG